MPGDDDIGREVIYRPFWDDDAKLRNAAITGKIVKVTAGYVWVRWEGSRRDVAEMARDLEWKR